MRVHDPAGIERRRRAGDRRSKKRRLFPHPGLALVVRALDPACLGARLTGGGFGGATINLVKHHEAPAFIDHMTSEYEKATGIKMTPLVCQIVDGAA